MRINESNYVDEAERVINELLEESKKRNGRASIVSTSKLRNLLAMTADIYNQAIVEPKDMLGEELKGRIEYLRIRFAYECGRAPEVKALVTKAKILDLLKEIKGSKKNYILFSRYMEALVAFRKFYGPREQD